MASIHEFFYYQSVRNWKKFRQEAKQKFNISFTEDFLQTTPKTQLGGVQILVHQENCKFAIEETFKKEFMK